MDGEEGGYLVHSGCRRSMAHTGWMGWPRIAREGQVLYRVTAGGSNAIGGRYNRADCETGLIPIHLAPPLSQPRVCATSDKRGASILSWGILELEVGVCNRSGSWRFPKYVSVAAAESGGVSTCPTSRKRQAWMESNVVMIRLSQRARNCWDPAKARRSMARSRPVVPAVGFTAASHLRGSFFIFRGWDGVRIFPAGHVPFLPRSPLPLSEWMFVFQDFSSPPHTDTFAIGPDKQQTAALPATIQGPQMRRSSDHSSTKFRCPFSTACVGGRCT